MFLEEISGFACSEGGVVARPFRLRALRWCVRFVLASSVPILLDWVSDLSRMSSVSNLKIEFEITLAIAILNNPKIVFLA